jgi:tRNA nucleotidyltransferase/poly(A) polymerase
MSNVNIYLVGGAVREILRGNDTKIKDWDFAVEAESFEQMRDWLALKGFEIYLETPQYFTIRARAPKNGFFFAGRDMSNLTFDFALCRTDGDYSDGRRPDSVKVGTIKTDLSRRDFTMNAIAMDASGTLIDPFDGEKDIRLQTIRCVGSTERLREDSLRMLRALRFAVQLDFELSGEVIDFLYNSENADLLDNVSEDRIRDELTKMFKVDTLESLYYLTTYAWIKKKVFEGDLWLMPTVKGK